MSPEEFRIAFLVHVAEDMRQSPETAADWLPVLLSIPAEFHLEHDVANYLLENRQNREDFKQAGISLRRSPFEEVFEINAVKQQLEITTGCKQNGHAVAVAYSSVQLSTENDPITKTYVEDSTMLHNVFTQCPPVKEAMRSMDSHLHNPFNKLYKAVEFARKCDKDPVKLKWAFESVQDQTKYGRWICKYQT